MPKQAKQSIQPTLNMTEKLNLIYATLAYPSDEFDILARLKVCKKLIDALIPEVKAHNKEKNEEKETEPTNQTDVIGFNIDNCHEEVSEDVEEANTRPKITNHTMQNLRKSAQSRNRRLASK